MEMCCAGWSSGLYLRMCPAWCAARYIRGVRELPFGGTASSASTASLVVLLLVTSPSSLLGEELPPEQADIAGCACMVIYISSPTKYSRVVANDICSPFARRGGRIRERKATVTPGRKMVHLVLAVHLPRLAKAETGSHPVTARNAGRAFDLSGPSAEWYNLIC